MRYPSNTNPESFTISGGEELRAVNFTLGWPSVNSVSGRVEIPDSGGRLFCSLVSLDQPSLSVAAVQTDSAGSFRLEGIPPGSYHLFASDPVRGCGGQGDLLDPALFMSFFCVTCSPRGPISMDLLATLCIGG